MEGMADSIDVVPIGAYYGKAGTVSCALDWNGFMSVLTSTSFLHFDTRSFDGKDQLIELELTT